MWSPGESSVNKLTIRRRECVKMVGALNAAEAIVASV
jgi:hypothetical protein